MPKVAIGLGILAVVGVFVVGMLIAQGNVSDSTNKKPIADSQGRQVKTMDSETAFRANRDQPLRESKRPGQKLRPNDRATKTTDATSSESSDRDLRAFGDVFGRISADELIKQYLADQKGTNQRYQGKVVELTGVITEVSKDVATEPSKVLTDLNVGDQSKKAIPMHATLSRPFTEHLERTWTGKTITLRGRYDGSIVPNLFSCVVVSMSDDTAMAMNGDAGKVPISPDELNQLKAGAEPLLAPSKSLGKEGVDFKRRMWALADDEFELRRARDKVFCTTFEMPKH